MTLIGPRYDRIALHDESMRTEFVTCYLASPGYHRGHWTC